MLITYPFHCRKGALTHPPSGKSFSKKRRTGVPVCRPKPLCHIIVKTADPIKGEDAKDRLSENIPLISLTKPANM